MDKLTKSVGVTFKAINKTVKLQTKATVTVFNNGDKYITLGSGSSYVLADYERWLLDTKLDFSKSVRSMKAAQFLEHKSKVGIKSEIIF